MSGECDGCDEHTLECESLNASEQQLLKITSTLTLDFLCSFKNEDLNTLTVADIRYFCRAWIKQNVKFDSSAMSR
jgi:hypothetical protein